MSTRNSHPVPAPLKPSPWGFAVLNDAPQSLPLEGKVPPQGVDEVSPPQRQNPPSSQKRERPRRGAPFPSLFISFSR